MTPTEWLMLASAMLATLGLGASAWVWFALRSDGSSLHGLASFEGMHFDEVIPVQSFPIEHGHYIG